MNLNIGSGYKRIDGFLNVDFNPDCKPDFLVDVGKETWPMEDSSVEKVIVHHVLEHFGEDFFHVMQELYRVCKDGAIIDVLVPFPRHDTFLIDPTHRRPILPATLAMFSKKHNRNDIENGGRETPIGIMYDVDFEMIDFRFTLEPSYQKRFQTLTEEECQRIVNESFNVIIETQILLMVVK